MGHKTTYWYCLILAHILTLSVVRSIKNSIDTFSKTINSVALVPKCLRSFS